MSQEAYSNPLAGSGSAYLQSNLLAARSQQDASLGRAGMALPLEFTRQRHTQSVNPFVVANAIQQQPQQFSTGVNHTLQPIHGSFSNSSPLTARFNSKSYLDSSQELQPVIDPPMLAGGGDSAHRVERSFQELQVRMASLQDVCPSPVLKQLETAVANSVDSLPINRHFTVITTPNETWLAPSEDDRDLINQAIVKDVSYEQEFNQTIALRQGKLRQTSTNIHNRQDWLGRDFVPGKTYNTHPTRIRIPHQGWKEKIKGPRQNRPIVRLDRKNLLALATEEEILVPIRLDIQHDNVSLRDTFTWNLKEAAISVEDFSRHLIIDLQIPNELSSQFYTDIVTTIKHQLDDFKMREDYYLNFNAKRFRTETEREEFNNDAKWWSCWRKKMRMESDDGEILCIPKSTDCHVGFDVLQRDFPVDLGSQEFRINIKIDVTLDKVNLKDQFDWDLTDVLNTPEDFAERYTADLGLPGEFTTAVAHSIREQIEIYMKSLFLIGYLDGDMVRVDDLRNSFLPTITDIFRPDILDYTPQLETLSLRELEHNERERERQTRRTRRQTRGRNRTTTLPDRDFVPTHRVPLPKPGGHAPTPITDSNGDLLSVSADLAVAFDIVRKLHEDRDGATLIRETSPPRSRYKATPKDPNENADADISRRTPLKKGRSKNPSYSPGTITPVLVDSTYTETSEIEAKVDVKPLLSTEVDYMQEDAYTGTTSIGPDHNSLDNTDNITKLSDVPDAAMVDPGSLASDIVVARLSNMTPQTSPDWLAKVTESLRATWPHDRFEAIPKPNLPDGWRVRCYDCPGKLYNVGPGETLQNFEVHLRNRLHRSNVQIRIDKTNPAT